MTLEETVLLLKEANVPAHRYTIGGLGGGECVGLAHDDDGVWRTYFSERGSRSSVVEHANEAAACAAFLDDVASIVEEFTGKRPDFS
jgi:hypothetical protein